MPAPPPQQGQGQGDNSLAPLWIILGLFFGAAAFWYFFHTQVSWGIVKIRYYEVLFVNLITDGSLDHTEYVLNTLTPQAIAGLTPRDLFNLSTIVGDYFKYPVLVLMVLFAVVVYNSSPKLKFRRTYSMQSLLDAEVTDWPQVTPVVKLDLVKTPLDEGPWSSALTPMQFAKKYKIFTTSQATSTEPTLSHKAQYIVSLMPEQAYRVFCMQVGRLWPGIEKCPIHIQALFAVFQARAEGDKDGANKLLWQIAKSTEHGKLDFNGTKQLYEKHKANKGAQLVLRSHAYILTMMASMLELAREDGVLASSDFIWLKPVDRPLWYMLNSVGRQTPYVEVGGPFAHWKAEIEFGSPITVPMVSEAVKALDAALKDILYVPDDDEAIDARS